MHNQDESTKQNPKYVTKLNNKITNKNFEMKKSA